MQEELNIEFTKVEKRYLSQPYRPNKKEFVNFWRNNYPYKINDIMTKRSVQA